MVEEGALSPRLWPTLGMTEYSGTLISSALLSLIWPFKSGWKAVLLRGAWECERLLAMAYAVFGKGPAICGKLRLACNQMASP